MRTLAAAIVIVSTLNFPAQAYHHHGLICGATAMARNGIHDPRFRLARNWLTLPRTSLHSGAVAFWWRNGRDSAGHRGGHVASIVSTSGNCSNAVIADEVGTRTANVCGATFVQP